MSSASPWLTGLPPELELLLCCARTRLDSELAARIETLVRGTLNWSYLPQLARRHGMLPLLYWHLHQVCPESVPQPVLAKLGADFQEHHKRNLFLTGELFKLLDRFESSGIPIFAFKGPLLAYSVYGNLALRPFKDLDLMVHKKDFLKAKEQLIRWGYRPLLNLSAAQEAHLLQAECELRFFGPDGQTIVELHWGITPGYFSFPLDVERLWDRLEPITVSGRKIQSLAREDLLLILCVHGARHLWERLEWICSVAELVRVQNESDWAESLRRARELGSERMFLLGLYLAKNPLGVALPESVSRKVKMDSAVPALAKRVMKRLLENTEVRAELFDEVFFHLRARERWRDRVQYCIRLPSTLTHGDWELVPLPSFLFPLYFILRPLRLVKKYGRAALRRSR